jgi:hypothetical protein
MIGIPKQQYKVEFIFPITVIALSAMTIFNQLSSEDISYLSVAIALTGITGATLYFGRDKYFPILLYIWSIAQALIVLSYKTNPINSHSTVTTVLNLSQVYKLDVGLRFTGEYGGSWLGINLLSILYFGLTRILSLSLLFDKEIKITAFKDNSTLSQFLPATATIEDRITLSKERNWLLVKLHYKEGTSTSIECALIKPKDNSNLKLNRAQIVYFLPVASRSMIKDENSRDEFVNGDYAIVN